MTELEIAIDEMIREVAPPPLCVSETAVRQLMPLLVELLERRKVASLPLASLPAAPDFEEWWAYAYF